MVGRAASLLSRRHWAALAGLTAALAAYTAGAGHLWQAGLWPDVLFISLVVIPATLALVWILLPLANRRELPFIGLGFVVLSILLRLAELDVLFNLAKVVALVALGFWFLTFFESVLWVALVASVIPLVDALSVWRGPTRHIVDKQPEVFTTLSFAFRIPGERPTANLGLPDLLFFALFLAASVRFRLRPGWTWLAMTASFGLTIVLTVAFDVIGLPALPLLSMAFLLVNADLLWRAVKRRDWRISRSSA